MDAFTCDNRAAIPVRAEGFEPSAHTRSGHRSGCDLRNNIECNSLGFPRFVPKCAQNVPTAPVADDYNQDFTATCGRPRRRQEPSRGVA